MAKKKTSKKKKSTPAKKYQSVKIDFSKKIGDFNPKGKKPHQIRFEKKRVYRERYRLKKKLEAGNLKASDEKKINSRLTKTEKYLEKITPKTSSKTTALRKTPFKKDDKGYQVVRVDFDRPVTEVDLEAASSEELIKDRKRIYNERYRLHKKLKNGSLKPSDRKKINKRVLATTRYLERVGRSLGTYREEEAAKKEMGISHVGGEKIFETVFKWAIIPMITKLHEFKTVKKATIEGNTYNLQSDIDIIITTLQSLEDEMDFTGEYTFDVVTDLSKGIVTITK